MNLVDFNSYLQLIQDLIAGNLRRHTFTPAELDLLLDVQASALRKSTKEECLRRYLRAIQQQIIRQDAAPMRFSRFCEFETHNGSSEPVQAARPALGVRTASQG